MMCCKNLRTGRGQQQPTKPQVLKLKRLGQRSGSRVTPTQPHINMPLPQIEMRLTPTPGAKPEFLAVLEPEGSSKTGNECEGVKAPPLWCQVVARPDQQSPRTIVIENYTREGWASSTSSKAWVVYHVESVDGRQKLPGFIKYLRERKKTAYGRFLSAKTSSSPSPSPSTFVWVIPDNQPSNSTLACRVAPLSSIANCPLKPLQAPPTAAAASAKNSPTPPPPADAAVAPSSSTNMKPPPVEAPKLSFQSKRKGLGLTGNLLKGIQRSNVAASHVGNGKAGLDHQTAAPGSSASVNFNLAGAASDLKTSMQIISDFRTDMEQKMIDFQSSSELILKLPLKVSDFHQKALTQTDASRITMDILKYCVNEAVEDADDRWICHKEPSEFADECVLAIYKREEDVPPDVMEDLNSVELPEVAKIEQHKLQEQRKQQEMKAQQIRERIQQEKLRSAGKRSGGAVSGLENQPDSKRQA